MSAVLEDQLSKLDDSVAYTARLLGAQAATVVALSNELAKCIGALRGVANGMEQVGEAPGTRAMLHEIADAAFVVLANATGVR